MSNCDCPAQVGVPQPARNMITEISELGWMYRRVNKYLQDPEPKEMKERGGRQLDDSLGLLVQSFCGAIQQELSEYYRMLA